MHLYFCIPAYSTIEPIVFLSFPYVFGMARPTTDPFLLIFPSFLVRILLFLLVFDPVSLLSHPEHIDRLEECIGCLL